MKTGRGSVIPAKAGIYLITFLLWFPAFAGTTAYAEPTVTARVSANDIALNGSITLTIEITGVSNINAPPSLELKDFQTEGAGQTQSTQWVNGQTSSMVTFNYVLTPIRAGALQIPPISLQSEGKSYSSQPITVTVRDDGGAPPRAAAAASGGAAPSRNVDVPSEGIKPVFMTANVDNASVYVGQQIILRIQFLRRPDIRLGSQPRYSEPDTTGFLVEQLKQQEFSTTINGTPYQVVELRTALFPTSDGDYAIGSSSIEMAVRTQTDPFDPNSLFESFFGRNQALRVNTRAIPVHVRALPKTKPANFAGAVGRFKLSARIDTSELEVGKPFNLIVTAEGVGNIQALKEPVLPPLNSFRRYESISSSKINKDGKFLYGSKEFKILLIPQISGQVTIPAISLPYFNPEERDYSAATTPPISLTIKSGTLSQNEPESPPQAGATESSEGIRVVEKDIRFIKSGTLRPGRPPLYLRGGFLLFNLFPPLFAFAAVLTRWRAIKRTADPAAYRSRGALRAAVRQLRRARKLLPAADPNPFYSALYAGVAGYLADKLGVSASGLLWEEVERRLAERHVSGELRSGIKNIFDESDMARFATSAFPTEVRERSLLSAESILSQLNKAL